MKFFIGFILVGAIGVGAYYFLFANAKGDVEVTGKIQVSQHQSYDINAPSVSGPLYLAVVRGTVKNNTDTHLKNIFIKYSVAGQQTSATVFDLAPRQMIEYNTSGVKTKAMNPEYYFDGVQYDEKTP
ncbi:MAG: hypothetical protein KJN64_01810 [Ignavibacteria bacterium]|nr:hypothetical protein [Ignavibacteria bacterium]MBT8381084.1 hypothetical protein [Ignavibacteria bacterium]MBT8391917.1 hypothetical protein [Ignavibacteria bacterium]NNJ53637.1 hypothetical protein [Ignavibacteriaceae bacterium]NNL19982.1 hypothetical protein [Ignavibacteriaceae bacterium]